VALPRPAVSITGAARAPEQTERRVSGERAAKCSEERLAFVLPLAAMAAAVDRGWRPILALTLDSDTVKQSGPDFLAVKPTGDSLAETTCDRLGRAVQLYG
jgi:hypothetical protein